MNILATIYVGAALIYQLSPYVDYRCKISAKMNQNILWVSIKYMEFQKGTIYIL